MTGAAAKRGQRFAFVFPPWVGHISPSLPIARRLSELGHEVVYISFNDLREKAEGTGARFFSVADVEPELFAGRGGDFPSMLSALKEECGIRDLGSAAAMWMLRNVMIERQLPGLLRTLRELKPTALVHCPLCSPEASYAAKVLDTPCIALNTFAGAGGLAGAVQSCFKDEKISWAGLDREMRAFGPNLAAVDQLRTKYGLEVTPGMGALPGYLSTLADATLTLTTTSEDLQDPMHPDLATAYAAAGARFVAVGPLLDLPGTWRAHGVASGDLAVEMEPDDIVARVHAARAAGRPVALVSMGTVVTGNMPTFGWQGRTKDEQGKPRGLTGRELCHAAWSGAFDAFGTNHPGEGPLLIVALGPQPDALDGLSVPPNALCVPSLPQVDILRAGVDVFLTHGGQNSFTEALSCATPLVVCPGFADQVVNAAKAVNLGVGLKVDRPFPEPGEEEAAAAVYRANVCEALRTVSVGPEFKRAAAMCAEGLQKNYAGVEYTVEFILSVGQRSATLEESLATPVVKFNSIPAVSGVAAAFSGA
uniref:UDP-glycosyltransferases domain-containing protein n=1 Tax=Pyrodinium bahamense TaxID=73915 RepID=A0A7S0FBG2_9DINO